jgi:hypothetical protein
MTRRALAITLMLAAFTSWLVVYESESQRPLNTALTYLLAVVAVGSCIWFIFDPALQRLIRRARKLPVITWTTLDDPDDPWGKLLVLRGLSGTSQVRCEVRAVDKEWTAGDVLIWDNPLRTETSLAFPRAFGDINGSGGRYRVRWLVETHAERNVMREVASGSFRLPDRPSPEPTPDASPGRGNDPGTNASDGSVSR